MRSAGPFWSAQIPARFDIAKRLPASLPPSVRFETGGDVDLRSRSAEHILARGDAESRALAENLSDCRAGYYRCEQVICPICAREYRRWLAAAVLQFIDDESDLRTATIFCETFAPGDLHLADLEKIHDRVRQRFRRAGIGNGCAIGGTEVAYRAQNKDWLLHLHVVTADVADTVFDAARKTFRSDDVAVPVRISDFVDPAQQAGYLQKFVTYHRPGEQSRGSRARAYPLPPARFRELARWWSRFEFGDFLLLLGARRRGKRIVRNAKREDS